MNSQLPQPDTKQIFASPLFTPLLSPFEAVIQKWKPSGKLSLVIEVEGKTRGSDIKWNDFAGTIKGIVQGASDETVCHLFSCNMVHFTGNCGVKSIDHLQLGSFPGGSTCKEAFPSLLKIVESFAYHKCNCGYLIGSDTDTKGYMGGTLTNIRVYGVDYVTSPKTWNPNYTWSKDHTISLFWKDLNACTHQNYWQ